LNIEHSNIERSRPKAATIDMHVHAFPDSLAGRAIESLEAACPWQAVGDGTVADLLASMDAAGVDVSAVFAIATKPDQVDPIVRWCKAIRSDRIEPFPSVHPAAPDCDKWIARIAAGGFKGIKLHPMYQGFAIDEPRMDRLYAACRDAGIIVAFHCGRDIGYPPEDDRASAARVANMLPRWPGLRVICSHMGGWREWDAAEAHLMEAPNVWLDTSFSLEDMGAERAVRMIRRHGAGRVVFATDWPWRSQSDSLAFLHGLGLSAAEEQAVRGGSAAALLGP
jgi:hypothetical protein